MSEDVARAFPFYGRYAQRRNGHRPALLTGRVRRDRCVLKLGRKEQEIIAPRVRRIAIEWLPTP